MQSFIFPRIIKTTQKQNALNIFTDGSSNGKAVYAVDNQNPTVIQTSPASAQIVELRAVAAVFQIFAQRPLNLYTDSQYIAKALIILETDCTLYCYPQF